MDGRVHILLAALLAAAPAARAASITSQFLYALDDPASRRSFGWAALTFDPHASELYLVSGGVVDIFNDNGIAIYDFGDDTALGQPVGVAALENGDLFVLGAQDQSAQLIRCNFRGEPQARVEISGLPPGFAARFSPGRIAAAQGKLYLADTNAMKVAVLAPSGSVLAAWDLASLVGLGPRDPGEAMMRGFNVDVDGNILFTVASVFSAYVLAPDGKLRAFGTKGSAPGKFNIVSGIAADDEGHLFLTDTLRAVVMVFDRDYRFLGEFGYRGDEPENLVSPFNLAVGNRRVYVSQSRGSVKAFAVRFD